MSRAVLLMLVLSLAAPARAEDETVLPDGVARDEVFALCTACHDTQVIRRSRLDRARWDGLMDWMVEKHGMAPLEGEQRREVVDYLAQHFGPGRAPGRGRSPFLQ